MKLPLRFLHKYPKLISSNLQMSVGPDECYKVRGSGTSNGFKTWPLNSEISPVDSFFFLMAHI